ncbi:FAD-dependent oxidoreductase [Actinoplanes sp. TBRC 11911]|uniref:NAD(P)/FAD-dependent oxidoreductase n=1 Tax=Actinoplanes sp. TBRC 11911 TaxID=2729386 RepID=UPI00145E7587|nr:FAD-dependent oxidoreductase [Actinoplanes sp. TBRC 11911]NMO51078.1 FAD-dependent oxidoreductase [Actinoplanes sp. TBRC 11911]
MHEIVILGAGYAGTIATVSLAARTRGRDDLHITLVNATERFTERLRLHQVAAGEELADLRLPALLDGSGVDLVIGWVTRIDADKRTVRVDDERELHYDTLVYALGGVADTAVVPGADAHAYTLNSAHDAKLLAARLSGTTRVVVCSSGLTGVEAAAEIAEQHPDAEVTLLGRREPGVEMGPKARAYLQNALKRMGVRFRSGVDIIKIGPSGVDLAGGETVGADVVLWSSGVRIAPLASAAGIQTDDHGRIVTDDTLRSVSHDSVYAVGDAAAIRQAYGVMHGTCQSGMPTGAHVAQSIARELAGRAPKRFRFGYIHVPVSIGRHDAVVQFSRPDHTPRRFFLTGRAATWYKETVSSAPWPTYARIAKRPIFGDYWTRGGRYTR